MAGSRNPNSTLPFPNPTSLSIPLPHCIIKHIRGNKNYIFSTKVKERIL